MNEQPFALYVLALAGGILLQHSFHFSAEVLFVALFIFVFGFCFIFFKSLKKLFSLVSLGLVLLLGAQIYQFQQVSKDFYAVTKINTALKVQVTQFLKPSEKFNKYTGLITNSKQPKLQQQNILIYVPKNAPLLLPGNQVLLRGILAPIPSAKNPHQFDYREYMAHKKITLAFFTKDLKISSSHVNAKGWFWKHKLKIKQLLHENGFSDLSIAFIASLGLGDRTDFSPALTHQLSYAGVLHLFAISGLHVGIIFIILLFLSYPLLALPHGRNIRILFSLFIIWVYAWFIGFTPSVTRASLMLSLYYITFLLHRPTNVYHTLFLSAFIVLLLQPHQLFDFGFLLSYAAVFFIVYFNFIRLKFRPKIPRAFRFVYDILMVSTFAQLGVLPLSIYYFGYFSWLFLGANVLLLSIASVLVAVTLFITISINVVLFPTFMVKAVNEATLWMDRFILFFSQQDDFILHHLSWNVFQIMGWFIILFMLKKAFEKFSLHYLLSILAVLFMMETSRLAEVYFASQRQQLIFFHQSHASILGWRNAKTLNVFYVGEDIDGLKEHILQPYMRKEKINRLNIMPWEASYSDESFHKIGKKMLVGNTKVILNPNRNDFSMTAFIKHKNDVVYLLDGSFYASDYKKLKPKLDHLYFTGFDGAYVLSPF